jgi:hypothetical protein
MAKVLGAILSLWAQSPWWRLAVLGLLVFSAAAYFAGSFNSSSGSNFTGPTPQYQLGDPASDQRLQSMLDSFSKLAREQRPGLRCEKLVQAAQTLTLGDRDRVTKQMSPAAVSARPALTAADACAAQIAESDRRFDRLAAAVGKANSGGPVAVVQAAEAFVAITGFDQSRDRFIADSGVIGKGKVLHDQVGESSNKIEALLDAGRRLMDDPSSDNFRQFEAADRLTELDRSRLTPDQARALDGLAETRKSLSTSKVRISRLSTLMTAAANGRPAPMPTLIDAVAAITPLDEVRATPDIRSLIGKARGLVQQKAWALLAEKLNTGQPGQDAEFDADVARLYGVVQATPGPTAAQGDLRDRAGLSVTALAESDSRRRELVAAARAWDNRGDTPVAGSDEALQAITAYDEKRFHEPERQAVATLKRAQIIQRGPEAGLTPVNIGVVPISASSSTGGDQNERFVRRLKERLKEFRFVDQPRDAAIVLDLDVQGWGEPQNGFEGPYRVQISAAHIAVRAVWAANPSEPFIDTTIEATGSARDDNEAKAAALLNGIAEIGKLLTNKAGALR